MKSLVVVATLIVLGWFAYAGYTAIMHEAEGEACEVAASNVAASGPNGIILAGAAMVSCMESKGHRYNPNRVDCDTYAVTPECFDPPLDLLIFRL